MILDQWHDPDASVHRALHIPGRSSRPLSAKKCAPLYRIRLGYSLADDRRVAVTESIEYIQCISSAHARW